MSARAAWVAGRPWTDGPVAEVRNPYDGAVVGTHVVPDAEAVEAAVAGAWAARGPAARPTTSCA